MKKMMRIFTCLCIAAIAISCSAQTDRQFDAVCQKLEIPPNIATLLKTYKQNRGGDNTAYFEQIRAFCIRRELGALRFGKPELVDPILDKQSIITLLGNPDLESTDGNLIYYFNSDNTWHLELAMNNGQLLRTQYRQLVDLEKIIQHVPPVDAR